VNAKLRVGLLEVKPPAVQLGEQVDQGGAVLAGPGEVEGDLGQPQPQLHLVVLDAGQGGLGPAEVGDKRVQHPAERLVADVRGPFVLRHREPQERLGRLLRHRAILVQRFAQILHGAHELDRSQPEPCLVVVRVGVECEQ